MFSHEVTVLSVFLSTDLKMAQYLKIPWRTMFLLQTWGSLFGTALNYVSTSDKLNFFMENAHHLTLRITGYNGYYHPKPS